MGAQGLSQIQEKVIEIMAVPEALKATSPGEIRKVKAAKIRAGRTQNLDRDQFERLSYLHQLSLLMLPRNETLARMYVSEMKRVSRRSVIRLSARVRNSYCRKCLRLTIVSKRHRLKHGRRHSFMLARCRKCGFTKRRIV